MADFKRIVDTVAPWIGAAAAGGVPGFVAMAAGRVSDALGFDVGPSADAIAKAITGATPEQMLAIKQADADFAVTMQKLGFENTQALESIAAGDRDSARKRQAAMRDYTPSIIGYLIIIAFAFVMYMFLSQQLPEQGSYRDSILIMIGTLAAAFTQVTNYFLGSSAGSAVKTDLMGAMRK